MNRLKADEYFERKQITPLLESLVTALSVDQPEEPLEFLEACIKKLKENRRGETVEWDYFIKDSKVRLGKKVQNKRVQVLEPISVANKEVVDTKEDSQAKAKDKLQAHPSWQHIVFVLGGPGCGKGTQCARISKEFDYIHLSVGDLLRAEVASGSELGDKLNAMMKEGLIVPMEITLRLLLNGMLSGINNQQQAKGFLIDGFPREISQATAFEQKLTPPAMILYFDCPEDVMMSRLLKRAETSGRSDDNRETILKRFKTFIETSYPVVEYYEKKGMARKISAVNSADKVFARVKTFFSVGTVAPVRNPSHQAWKHVVFVLGQTGSGRSSHCARLSAQFNYIHISSGDLLRAEAASASDLGQELQTLMKEGRLIPTRTILKFLQIEMDRRLEELANAEGFLLDGFPASREQAIVFEREIAACEMILYLEANLNQLTSRSLDRKTPTKRVDDTLEAFQKREATFTEMVMPVIDYYERVNKVKKINTGAEIESVYPKISVHFTRGFVVPTTPDYIAPVDGTMVGITTSGSEEGLEVGLTTLSDDKNAKVHPTEKHLVFVLGGPGSGKGTQCDAIRTTLGYVHLSTGDLLRAEVAKTDSVLGNEISELMKQGKMVPTEITLKLLIQAMEEKSDAKGFLIDGFPRTMDQAIEFEQTVGKAKFILFFDCPSDVLVERLIKRGLTSGRADDNEESIKKRITTFVETSIPVIEYFEKDGRVKKVQSDKPVEQVTEGTLKCFE